RTFAPVVGDGCRAAYMSGWDLLGYDLNLLSTIAPAATSPLPHAWLLARPRRGPTTLRMPSTPVRAGRRGCLLALAITAGLAAPRRSSADVITIDDAGMPGTTDIPFTCSVNGDRLLWLPTMGFIYRNVEPFILSPGDTIAFDIQMPAAGPADLGFRPQ